VRLIAPPTREIVAQRVGQRERERQGRLGLRLVATYAAQRHAAGMAAEGLREALDSYIQAQDEFVHLTGYPAELVLRTCRDAGASGSS
jgi:hypothetical protein